MGDRLRRALQGDRTTIWLLGGAGGIALCVAVAVWWLVAPPSTNTGQQLVARSEPPPKAPASVPEPTLVALATAQPTPNETPEPSPFAGIAQPPAEPPQRTAPMHHIV